MKAKLITLSVLSFGLLMYFANQQIYFPFIIIPFVGFSITAFMWPEPDERKRKSKSKGYERSDPDLLDVAGGAVKVVKNLKGSERNASDVDIDVDL